MSFIKSVFIKWIQHPAATLWCMRWESLFVDLEAQLDSEVRRGRAAEIQDMIRVQRSQIRLADRFEGQLGRDIALRLTNGAQERGELRVVGEDWLNLRQAHRELLVPMWSIVMISGLSQRAQLVADPAQPKRRVTLGSALRAIARDRSAVVARLSSTASDPVKITGTLSIPGKDFLEILTHPSDEFSREESIHGSVVVPWSALISLRREARD